METTGRLMYVAHAFPTQFLWAPCHNLRPSMPDLSNYLLTSLPLILYMHLLITLFGEFYDMPERVGASSE